MDVSFRLLELAEMHPRLLWDAITTAAAAVLGQASAHPPFLFHLAVENVPGFGSGELRLACDPTGIREDHITRARRTFEPSRLVELAAIAMAGAGLYHAGGHEIWDLAVRGSAADYLVGASQHRLEIAGRSRRRDLDVAWQQKWQRLTGHAQGGCYVCVAEFETPAGRLAFTGLE